MNKSAIEDIVKRVYPQIAKDLGRSKKSTPKVEVHNNVLAMHSGIPDHPGGEEEHAEYDYKNNTIYLFKVALKTEQLVIQALLHEYTHACQDEKKYQAARAAGYANNPYEKAAHRAEKTWRKYMNKNESLNEIKKGDWIRSAYGDLGLVNKVKGQAAYVSFDGSRSFQPMRVADLKRTKELHKGKVVYSESLLEYCGCGGAGRKDASIQLAEYLKKQTIEEADYQGRDVKLNKPMQGDVKKFKVYVKNAKGNVVKVNFGQKGMVIKKDNPGAKKSFRARHKCDQSKPKTSAGYWSCKAW